jgi:hypothetical protein
VKKLSMALFGLLATAPDVRAQGLVCSLGVATPSYSLGTDQAAPPGLSKDLKRIITLLCPKGCGRVGLVKNASASSMLAMNVGNGNYKIAYNSAFLDRVQRVYGPDAAFGILAHEVGHHVDMNGNPAAWMDLSWNSEARADAWAGCALAKAAMKTEGFKAALRAVVSSSSGADLVLESRSSALQRGYEGCGGGFKLAVSETQPTSAKMGGCANSGECRAGRVCSKGRCQDRLSPGVCLKDIDCADNQICGAIGRCEEPVESTEAAFRTAAETKFDGADCHKQCDGERRRCRIAAVKGLNVCLARVRSDPEYVGCTCPTWPASKPECRQICEGAFDRGETCESDYAPTREACLSAAPCGECDSNPPVLRRRERESALK